MHVLVSEIDYVFQTPLKEIKNKDIVISLSRKWNLLCLSPPRNVLISQCGTPLAASGTSGANIDLEQQFQHAVLMSERIGRYIRHRNSRWNR